MKRILIISLSAFYLLLTLGVSINVHYCGGKIKSVTLIVEQGSCCGDKEDVPDCCDDERTFVQLEEVHQAPNNVRIPDLQSFVLSIPVPLSLLNKTLETPDFIHPENHSPPNPHPLWLINCRLTYYG